MSGIETLLPYIGKKRNGKIPTIIIDSREAKTAPTLVPSFTERLVYFRSAHLITHGSVAGNSRIFSIKSF